MLQDFVVVQFVSELQKALFRSALLQFAVGLCHLISVPQNKNLLLKHLKLFANKLCIVRPDLYYAVVYLNQKAFIFR